MDNDEQVLAQDDELSIMMLDQLDQCTHVKTSRKVVLEYLVHCKPE